MISFPNCKINLGLTILSPREDGFHTIDTIFYPLPLLHDVLEIIPANKCDNNIQFFTTGINVNINEADNLCCRAFRILQKDYPSLPSIEMHLHKVIPAGAGMGGGSSDGAFTLKLLNEQFELSLSNEQLISYAEQLGSDCPFFIINKPCYATGKGEVLEEISLDLAAYNIILVNPGIHIDTRWAFSNWDKNVNLSDKDRERKKIEDIIQQPLSTWKKELINDFEKPVFKNYPLLNEIKQILYKNGALYAGMSGSGSTIYGIYEKGSRMPLFEGNGYFIKTV